MIWFQKTAAVCLLLAAALLSTAFTDIVDTPTNGEAELPATAGEAVQKQKYTEEQKTLMKQLTGHWTGKFPVVVNVVKTAEGAAQRQFFNEPMTMDFSYDANSPEKGPRLFLTANSNPAAYMYPREWRISGENLIIALDSGPVEATITVALSAEGVLTGTYLQKGQSMAMTMKRTSKTPVDFSGTPQFTFEGEADSVWYERLRDYPTYTETGASIPFQYELGVNSKNIRINTDYRVIKATQGKTDIQKMIVLLNLVSDNFQHDGASGMPEKTDALSCIKYAQENGGSIECRGLSSILAEMCRMAGIPAKAVMCIPSKDPCEDCHVVVHAYSQSLGRWVMLDPTYRLILRDELGNYLDLPTLREKLISGETVVPNENAGRNGTRLYMDYYRAYMAKNMFRFSTLTQFSFDAANQPGNRENMLLPVDYVIPFLQYRTEKLTTSANEFWAVPKGMEKPVAAPAAPAASAQQGAKKTQTAA